MNNRYIGTHVPAVDRQENNNYRVISEQYFGYLVGQMREVIEATLVNEKQQKAFQSIILDRMYNWFDSIGDQLSKEEFDEASKKHWENLK